MTARRIVAAVLGCALFAPLCGAAFARPMRQKMPDPGKGYKWQTIAKGQGLKPADIKQLGRNKILVTNEAYKQVFTPYIKSGIPLFITSDSLLNAFHVLYEESVLRMENANARKLPEILRFIWNNLEAIDAGMKGKPKLVAAAKRRAQVVIGTALRLLGDKTMKPDNAVATLIDAEVKRVIEAKATMKPKWLGPPDDPTFTALDYSRYRPRGFYTKSDDLKRYFRALSWLQSIPFRLSKDEELLSILMMGNCVTYNRFRNDPSKLKEYHDFFRCYSQFVGVGDDWDLMTAAQVAQNKNDLDPGSLPRKRSSLLERAKNYGRAPAINDQIRFAPEDPTKTAEPNFRIISAYRTPDAILFHRTTDLRQFERPFPAGLELCAALESSWARSKLEYKDKQKLLATIDRCRASFEGESLYCRYLDCLAALLDKPEPDAPEFMTRDSWQIKSCQTALGGWAQLRHTWALQAKQTVMYLGMARKPAGFVEPEPEFFARMARFVRDTEGLLRQAGAFTPDTTSLVADLRIAADLIEKKDIAHKGKAALKELSLKEGMLLSKIEWVFWAAKLRPPDDEENIPKFFGKLTRELRQLADQIEKGQVPDSPALKEALKEAAVDVQPLWRRLGDLCLKLEALAHKQLRKRPFCAADEAFIKGYGEVLARIMLYGGNSYLTPNDDAPRVVDVFYNPMSSKCLEVGVGRARAIYALYPLKGGEVLCRGAVMPYYEFQSWTRLTDREWQRLLDSPKRPGIPTWVKSIVAGRELRKPTLKSD